MLGDADLKNRELVKSKLSSLGFEAALIMRIASVNEQVTPVGGPYGTFDGYYDWAGAAVYAPGYLETDTIVHVVSNLYSLKDQKLIWSGVSQTFDPGFSAIVHERRLEGGRQVDREGCTSFSDERTPTSRAADRVTVRFPPGVTCPEALLLRGAATSPLSGFALPFDSMFLADIVYSMVTLSPTFTSLGALVSLSRAICHFSFPF